MFMAGFLVGGVGASTGDLRKAEGERTKMGSMAMHGNLLDGEGWEVDRRSLHPSGYCGYSISPR